MVFGMKGGDRIGVAPREQCCCGPWTPCYLVGIGGPGAEGAGAGGQGDQQKARDTQGKDRKAGKGEFRGRVL